MRFGNTSISKQKRKQTDDLVLNREANRWNTGQHSERVIGGSNTASYKPSSAVTNATGVTASGGSGSSGSGAGSSGTSTSTNSYVDQLNSLYDQIVNRGEFQYDLNGDLLYRQMADQYTQLGKQAMRDSMGQGAALTGGYGNSYANLVGNQAYQNYLTQLNEAIPSLYKQAYNEWLDEGEELVTKYNTVLKHPDNVASITPSASGTSDSVSSGNDSQTDYSKAIGGLLSGVASSTPTYFVAPATEDGTEVDWASYYPELYEELTKKKYT